MQRAIETGGGGGGVGVVVVVVVVIIIVVVVVAVVASGNQLTFAYRRSRRCACSRDVCILFLVTS